MEGKEGALRGREGSERGRRWEKNGSNNFSNPQFRISRNMLGTDRQTD